MNSFTDQMTGFESQLARLESRLNGCVRSGSGKSGPDGGSAATSLPVFTSELEILKERLARVEDRLDRRKPPIRLPNPCLDEIWERMDEVEASTSKLADDTLAAVEAVHGKLNGLEQTVSERARGEIADVEARLQERLTDGIEKIAIVLRKLVSVHRKYSRSSSPVAQPSRLSTSEKQRLIDDLYREIEFIQGA